MSLLFKFILSITAFFAFLGSCCAGDTLDTRNLAFAISLGNDARLASIDQNQVNKTSQTIFIKPGTFLVLIKDRKFKNRTLALTEQGIWAYVPTDRSNIINENMLMRILFSRMSRGYAWRSFSHDVSIAENKCVEFTRSEIIPLQDLNSSKTKIFFPKEELLISDKLEIIESSCNVDLLEDQVFNINDNASTSYVDLSEKVKEKFEKYVTEQYRNAFLAIKNIDKMRRTEERTFNKVRNEISKSSYEHFPKLINLGSLFDLSCDSTERTFSDVQISEIQKKISGSIKASLNFLEIGTGIEEAELIKTTSTVSQKIRDGISASERAYLLKGLDENDFVFFGTVNSCTDAASGYSYKTDPKWQRMYWHEISTSPYTIDVNNFEEIREAGIFWNQKRGELGATCYQLDYKKSKEILEQSIEENQAELFLAHYLRADPKLGSKSWKRVFECR